jgi:dihydrofolate reductase
MPFFLRSVSISPPAVRRAHEGRPNRPPHHPKERVMRKVTAGLFHSLDGAVEAPDQWQFDAFDDELGALLGKTLAATDTVILGRVGYEEWAGFWPDAEFDDDFKTFINTVPKHVASRTLTGPLAWSHSSLIPGDLNTFVRDLKAKEGGDIAVMASISLVRQLFLAGLLDELTLITHPVVAGSRYRRLFDAADPVRLALLRSQTTSQGNVVQTYGLRP